MLIQEIENLPDSAGIYQYFDDKSHLLYVGKAKNLKKRVKSYFVFKPKLAANPKNSLRIQNMIAQCKHLEFISTDSEADALILENSLIKQLRPKYNILLRDDKTYPYIYIDLSEDFPRFNISRKLIKKPKIKYYGPFFKGAKELLNALYENYKLKQKNSCKSPCIFYQMKRCLAPCANMVSKQEYDKIVKEATSSLLNPSILIKNLEKKMLFYAENENYEEAAKIRDSIKTINELKTKVKIDIAKLENFDVFAFANKGINICTIRFVIQNGKLISSKTNISKNILKDIDANEIYKQMIIENFNTQNPLNSKTIYVRDEFKDLEPLQDLLCDRFKQKISIKVPKNNEKKQICDLAYKNALLFLENNDKKEDKILQKLFDFFELNNFPSCIEIFDNSHLQGNATVGAMVSYNEGKLDKNRYRLFHLKAKNEYEQMKELLLRRLEMIDELSVPDMWLIDGGKTLLNLAIDLVKSYGLNIDVLAISKEKMDNKTRRAKGFANDEIHSSLSSFKLNNSDEKLLFLQRLRDEAHRFAISFHKKTRQKQNLQSSKLQNLGISKAYIQRLLQYFGSFEAIYEADFESIKKVSTQNIALKIQKLKTKSE
ncbi:excinuclease ABC subunit UvrC [uncultured Campylobacter sp.]|uniref:excinuclease ABC subunit UvrC n=1 Tax=uncultured Campylobacter sp. TaxID=218934 RepID=UPI00260187A7|nr:excinuclease ABC subunit UvrC [uncultured Campylobacter sp.]